MLIQNHSTIDGYALYVASIFIDLLPSTFRLLTPES
jgi:hypothetical protein